MPNFTEFLPDCVSFENNAAVGCFFPVFLLTYAYGLAAVLARYDGSLGTRHPLYPKPHSFVLGVLLQYELSNANPKYGTCC